MDESGPHVENRTLFYEQLNCVPESSVSRLL